MPMDVCDGAEGAQERDLFDLVDRGPELTQE